MTSEEYSLYLQEIMKARRQAHSPAKSPSLRHKEDTLLTSLRGRNVDCDNSIRLGPNRQYLFKHLLDDTEPQCSSQEVFQSVPTLAKYDLSPSSIRPNEAMWRRKSDSNALPSSTQGKKSFKQFEARFCLLFDFRIIIIIITLRRIQIAPYTPILVSWSVDFYKL